MGSYSQNLGGNPIETVQITGYLYPDPLYLGIAITYGSANNDPLSGLSHAFGFANDLIEGQLAATTLFLAPWGTSAGAGVELLNKALFYTGIPLIVAAQAFQAAADISSGVPPAVAAAGASVNVAATVGAGLSGDALGGAAFASLFGPEAAPFGAALGGVAFAFGVEASLPTNQTLGEGALGIGPSWQVTPTF